jgi:hypothetical protein
MPGSDCEPDEDGYVRTEAPSWDRVDGRQVCASCLTPAEDRELARMFIAEMRAVARAAEAQPVPEGLQSLMEYALLLQARLDAFDGTDTQAVGSAS